MIPSSNDTTCPNCHAALYCPCPACRGREPAYVAEMDHYHWDESGEIMVCPRCGYSDCEDGWYE
jgi:uncharacterized protein YbaR (Trm112 family)